jgi:hypothetical protein
VAGAGIRTKVADEPHVDDGGGELGANHVLELAFAKVHEMNLHPPRASLPRGSIHTADLVVLQQTPGKKAALAARDPGNEHLFHGFPEGWSPRVTPTATPF